MRDAVFRHQDRLLIGAEIYSRAHEKPWQQHPLRVGEDGPYCHGVRCRVHGDVGELQGSGFPVFGAVVQQQAHRRFAFARELQLAARNLLPQLLTFHGRLIQVDVDRVGLLHHCHQRCRARLHVCALRDERGADAARDGRRHFGVAEVDGSGLNGCKSGGNVRFGLLLRGDCVDVGLLADCICSDQHFVALSLRGCRFNVGASARKLGSRAVQRRAIGCGIYLKETLVGGYVGAFHEIAALDDAIDACTYLRNEESGSSAGQFGRHRHCHRMYRDHGNFRCGGCGWRRFSTATTQRERQDE
jgi:hypothetical protein